MTYLAWLVALCVGVFSLAVALPLWLTLDDFAGDPEPLNRRRNQALIASALGVAGLIATALLTPIALL